MTSPETKKPLKILIIAPTLDIFLGGQAVQAARLLEKLNQEPNIQADIQSIGPVFFPTLQTIKYLRTFLSSVFPALLFGGEFLGFHINSASKQFA